MGKNYTLREREHALKLAKEVGPYKAARQLGIATNTVRRWVEPDFAERENRANAKRRRIPCRICGRPCSRYGRRHPEFADLCHEHAVEALADQERGFTVKQIADMYLEESLSTNEIARRIGSTQSAVHALLTRHGYQIRPRDHAIKLRPGGYGARKLSPEEIYRLRDAGVSVPKIAARLGASVSSIRYHLARRELKSLPD